MERKKSRTIWKKEYLEDVELFDPQHNVNIISKHQKIYLFGICIINRHTKSNVHWNIKAQDYYWEIQKELRDIDIKKQKLGFQ